MALQLTGLARLPLLVLARAKELGLATEGTVPAVRLDDVAAAARTIGYEILTELGRRYDRIAVDD